MKLAITGATGFVGSRLIAASVAAGHEVRALTRRAQPERDGIDWVTGSLETPDALDALVRDADAVIHVAGVVNARDRDGFAAGNIDGTRAVLAAAEGSGVHRFVHVSSLAAREPGLSAYGWSKSDAEGLVTGSRADWDIVRPPAVYGPGDMEMRELFRMAKRGIALLPPGGRLSVIHVDDLARLLLSLAARPATRAVYEPDDGRLGGWSHTAFAHAIGDAVGRKVRAVSLPRRILDLGARADALIRRGGAKLTPDRVSYFCHPDWVSDPLRRPPPALWRPRIETSAGLAETAAWYRAQGLL
ncbi:NAD-dependent epimerase/dehydratase family protein [Sphingomonas sp.]|uniref:NAD-dependent epimerase/dehydratase family protein n=1 Tax=Sphingomonas sp. TaxID=28214 RepID=UPI002DD657F5|nr:NAD(P)-dependent oxidoreductase [Sphingomonas sp.]